MLRMFYDNKNKFNFRVFVLFCEMFRPTQVPSNCDAHPFERRVVKGVTRWCLFTKGWEESPPSPPGPLRQLKFIVSRISGR